ncbi:MAG TPA: 30S ribosomal protein S18 [Candidatus Merdivicinus excrementipullorum]|jgi:small subunit ribosomal protein S18|uniref:Small ribosomal subunit protein bS18 n=1 Tax=Candidatus Merdivicinus excrementipullorum TaxID=2840867 RepID=A0A9D1FNK4_9FIRM|nr:30S ribosomal protein S18 [Candidatus Merdivicinus excrementipullorum]HIV19261.1 30S ribosomal protein S18 [Candidatus Merdivicinus intestinigallinarum]
MMDRNNRGGRKPRRKVCAFCVDKVENIDYKTIGKYSRKVLSERAKIIPRRVTGTCAKHQRQLTVAVKRARHLALLPFVND